jgi:hypothetical protein
MAGSFSASPDPTRAYLLRSVLEASPLTVVAQAVSVATQDARTFYVERLDGGWRWSFVHPGGGYPLLRMTARFLRIDYQQIIVGFRTLAPGICIVCADPDDPAPAQAWALIDFHRPTAASEVAERIADTLK